MVERLQSIIDKMNLPFYIDSFRNYGEKKSAGFEIKDNISNDVIFSMDIDVNRTIPETKEYKIDECTFIGNSPYQIIADKVYVVSTTKVFRRIKDLIDLYYISRIISFDKIKVLNILNKNSKTLDNFDSFLNRKDDLIHSYNLFKIYDGINKPDFELVYNSVKNFIKDILPNN